MPAKKETKQVAAKAPAKGAQKGSAKGKSEKSKALKAQKAIQKGTAVKSRKVRTTIRFRRPTTLKLASKPKYPRRGMPSTKKFDQYRIVKHPLTTETAMKKIEDHNTIVFIVDLNANKKQIAAAVNKLYDVKVAKVNTLIRPDGKKKAFVRLTWSPKRAWSRQGLGEIARSSSDHRRDLPVDGLSCAASGASRRPAFATAGV